MTLFKGIVAIAAIAGLCGAARAQSGPATYSVTTPGVMPGGSLTIARGLSSAGHITGYGDAAQGDTQAWVATTGSPSPVPAAAGSMAFANAVNASGNVAGHSFASDLTTFTAFLYTGGAYVTIPTLGGAHNSATAINDAGTARNPA